MNVNACSTFCLLATVFAMGGQVHGQFWYGNDNSQAAGTQRTELLPGGPNSAATAPNTGATQGSTFLPLQSNPWRRSARVAQLPAPSSAAPSGGDSAGLPAPTDSSTLAAPSNAQLNTLPAPQSGQVMNGQYSAQPVWSPGNAWGPAMGGAYGAAGGGCGIGGYPGGSCGPHPVNPLIGTKQPRPVGFMFRWDRLYLTIDNPDSNITIGDPDSAGITFLNSIPYPLTNSTDTNFIDRDPTFGDRLEFGFLGANYGWLGSVLLWGGTNEINITGGQIQFDDPTGTLLLGYQDGDDDNIDDDLDGDGVYGRFGRLVFIDPDGNKIYEAAPTDTDDLVYWLPTFGEISVRNRTDINGFELMGYVNRGSTESLVWSWMLGVRYVDLNDRLTINGAGSFLDETEISTSIENFLVGPQIGLQSCYCRGPWAINLSGRFLAAVNAQRGRQRGFFASKGGFSDADPNAVPNGQNAPMNLFPTGFASFQTDNQFSPVVEWRVESIYDLTRWLAVRIGYTGMYFGGIGRAASSDIDFSLPEFGFNLNNDDEVFANALTLGLEITY